MCIVLSTSRQRKGRGIFPRRPAGHGRRAGPEDEDSGMRRFAVVRVALLLGVLGLAPESFAGNARVAALPVALRAHGFAPGPVDGVRGPSTSGALLRFQRAKGLVPDGRVGPVTRRA